MTMGPICPIGPIGPIGLMGRMGPMGLMRHLLLTCVTISLFAVFTNAGLSQTAGPPATFGPANGLFNLKLDAGAIVSLRRAQDRVDTEYIQTNRRLGDVFLRFRGKD